MANDEVPLTPETTEEEDYIATPWHFKLLVLAFVLYLIYRGVQIVVWLAERYF